MLDVDAIVALVRAASTRDRVSLRLLSKRGIRKMLEPFMKAGFDLSELDSGGTLPWPRLNDPGKVAKTTNMDTLNDLPDAETDPALTLVYLRVSKISFVPYSHRVSIACWRQDIRSLQSSTWSGTWHPQLPLNRAAQS